MNRSSKYGFYLPQNTDPISVSDFNYNFQLIDDNLITEAQSFTSAQKSIARENIGAADDSDYSSFKENFTAPEDKKVTRIGTYFTERDNFKARRFGNSVVIFSYINITTQVPNGTEFADIGFSSASGVFLFTSDDGTKQCVVSCNAGKLTPNKNLETGYYYVVGSGLAYI